MKRREDNLKKLIYKQSYELSAVQEDLDLEPLFLLPISSKEITELAFTS